MIIEDPVIVTFTLFSTKPIYITLWTLIGFLGNNVLFSLRVLVQWIASEREKRSVAPRVFWWISLIAALIVILYTLQRSMDPRFADRPSALPFLIGLLISLVPYVRNLMLSYNVARKWHIVSYFFAAIVFGFCSVLLFRIDVPLVRSSWFILGMTGSLLWYTRFLWQWLYAERKKRSDFPMSFWYASFFGVSLNMVYSLMMGDIVFILGFMFNIIPITRNIILIKRHQRVRVV